MNRTVLFAGLLTVMLMNSGCGSESEYVRFSLPMGKASLALVEHVRKTFETTYSNYTLYWVEPSGRRKICAMTADASLYRKPSPDEFFHRLNLSAGIYEWGIMVNPDEFNPIEYGIIAKCLENALKSAPKGKDTPDCFRNIGSIRYINEESLRRLYKTSVNQLSVDVSPNGSITTLLYAGTQNEEGTLIGRVTDNGRILLIREESLQVWREKGIDFIQVLKKAIDGKGRTPESEFIIKTVPSEELSRLADEWQAQLEGK